MNNDNLKEIRIVFLGSSSFSIPSLTALYDAKARIAGVITQPDKPAGRGQKTALPIVKEWALGHGIPVFQPEKIKKPEDYQFLTALSPDLLIVVAYGKILPLSMIKIARLGAVNVHGSLLPKYRGASPVQAALLAGDKSSGATIMQLDEGMDTGLILSKKEIPIEPNDTGESLSRKIAELGAKLLVETLQGWFDKKITPVPQNNAEASVCFKVSKDDGKIDWQKPAHEIERTIRAYHPWPSAWTSYNQNETRMKIIAARVSKTVPEQNIPSGTIYLNEDKEPSVACGGNSSLALETVQPENKKKMPAKEFLLGHPGIIGSRLL